jgi:hypothetical protein
LDDLIEFFVEFLKRYRTLDAILKLIESAKIREFDELLEAVAIQISALCRALLCHLSIGVFHETRAHDGSRQHGHDQSS